MTPRTVAGLALAGMLGGCAVGPDYQAPGPVAAATAPFANAAPVDRVAALPDRWWSLYADPALDALVQEALVHNGDLRVAAANLERAEAVLRGTRSALLPATQVSGNAGYQRNASNGQAGEVLGGSAALSYEVDLFGRVRRSVQAARADLAASEANRDAVRVAIAAATTQAYLNVCTLGARSAVADRSIALATQGLELTRKQVELGVGSEFQVARASVLADQTRALGAQLDGLRRQSLADLAVLLGRPPGGEIAGAAQCRARPRLVQAIPTGDGAALLARRPDVRAAERQLAADTARIGVATAGLYPSIGLGASVSSATQAGGSPLGARRGVTFSVGPLLSWSFPNIVAARAEISAAGAVARASLARFDTIVVSALGEVERALAAYDAELRRNAALDAAVASSRRALELADVRVRYGSISQLELLDVQRDLIATESALAESDGVVAANQVALFRALGGGWQEAPAVDQTPRALSQPPR